MYNTPHLTSREVDKTKVFIHYTLVLGSCWQRNKKSVTIVGNCLICEHYRKNLELCYCLVGSGSGKNVQNRQDPEQQRNSQKNRRLTLLARCLTSATTFIIFLFLRRRTRWPAGRALFLELIDQSGEGDVAFVHKPGWTVPSSFFNDIKAAADKKITRYLATTKELAAVYKVLKTNTAAASISGDIRI